MQVIHGPDIVLVTSYMMNWLGGRYTGRLGECGQRAVIGFFTQGVFVATSLLMEALENSMVETVGVIKRG